MHHFLFKNYICTTLQDCIIKIHLCSSSFSVLPFQANNLCKSMKVPLREEHFLSEILQYQSQQGSSSNTGVLL